MHSFLHDLSNLLAIIQGKVHQANKLVATLEDKEKTEAVEMRLGSALKAIERMEALLRTEKNAQEKKAGAA